MRIENPILHDICENPPNFHIWDNLPSYGGFTLPFFDFFEKIVDDYSKKSPNQKLSFLETGAGLSTIFFLAKDFNVTSFSLDDVIGRIKLYLESKPPVYVDNWFPYSGYSEFLLPQYAKENFLSIDIALIDGNHFVSSVFLDYVYVNCVLKKDGLLLLDDTQLPGPFGVSKLLDWLKEDYLYIESFGKLRLYKKISSNTISCANANDFLWT